MKSIQNWLLLISMVCLPLCWAILKFSGFEWEKYPILTAFLSGFSIVISAFLLCWAAEVAQKDISQVLAIAFLALIAVLPEYAVDIYLTWMAGKDHTYISYALANMTGANRLLIGFGWSLVVILYWILKKEKAIHLEESHGIELSFLCLATLYSFILPIKGNLSLIDGIILIAIFGFYITSASKARVIEPELHGITLELGMLPRTLRRIVITFLFLYAGFIIFISAKPFAEVLISIGRTLGIDEFILIQWVAPLASETPEFLAASLFVFKAKPTMGLGTLISSKVNQWTLLVGLIPIIFCISSSKLCPMVIDERQIEELFLTSGQSIFAVVLLCTFYLSVKSAWILFILFFTQLIFPSKEIRLIYGFVYLGLTLFILVKDRTRLKGFFSLFIRKCKC
ncbi:TPA: sodium:proton exchanger [bacterium]|nr:sodium:proton exchanger [bacterium]